MANDAKLKIVIEAMNSASKDLKDLQSELGGVEKSGKKAGESTKSFRDSLSSIAGVAAKTSAGIAGVGVTMNKIFDIGKAGAGVTQTAESFEFLRQKVGAVPDLLDKLREASRGTISDLDIMQSTAVLLAGTTGEMAKQFANATPELMEIAKAANKLNPALGDTTFLYDSLAKGIKRGSPMILDNLGIIVSIGEANEKYAKALGKTVEQLTEEEKKVALLNETLSKGKTMLDQVGGTTESATDAYERMDAALENLTNTYKAKLAPGITSAANAVVDLTTGISRVQDVANEHLTTVANTSKTYEEYYDEVVRVAGELGWMAGKVTLLTEEEWLAQAATKILTAESDRLTKQAIAAKEALEGQTVATAAVKDATNSAEAAMRSYTEQLLFSIASQGLNEYQALALAYSMGLVDERTVYATEKVKGYQELLANGTITLETYNALVTGLGDALDGMPDDVSIDVWLNMHGYDEFQRLSNSIGTGTPGIGTQMPTMQASGGNVYTGNPYIWQEYSRGGAEAFIPSMDGYILSRSDAAAALASGGKSGGSTTYTLNIYEAGGVVDPVGSIALLEAMAGG